MKKFLMTFAAMLLVSVSAVAQSSETPLKGDVNEDGVVDVADINAIITIIKNNAQQETTYYFSIGTTPVTAENYTTANNATTTIPTTIEYTSSQRTAHYILIPSNKTLSIVDKNIGAPIPVTEQTSAGISGHKLYKTNGAIASGATVVVTLKGVTNYYWYVGQSNPDEMTSIAPIVTDTSSPGWRLTGNSLTSTYNYDSTSNPISSDPSQNAPWYFALPENSGLGVFDAQNTNYATGTPVSNVIINGIKYNIWNTGASRKFGAYTVKNTTTYYWYVGQSNPVEMTTIDPIVTDETSAGWRLIGTTLPTYNSSNKLYDSNGTIITTGTSLATQWVAIPNESSACVRDGAGNDGTTVSICTRKDNKILNGVEYKVYEWNSKAKKLGYDIY